MRAYSASSEEALRARDLLKDWTAEGFLTGAQYQQLEPDTVCDFRSTNIFLRVVLFIFTLLIVGSAALLFILVFLQQSASPTTGIFWLIFSAISYAATEFAVSRFRLHRYGIEEGLAASSVMLLCAGLQLAFFRETSFSVPAAGALASCWIWHRFGLPYAPLAAMLFIPWLADEWTASPAAHHAMIASIYAIALAIVAAIRRPHRDAYLNHQYSIAEALLWLGIYLAINLQLSSLNAIGFWSSVTANAADFSRPFYWTTWVLTWCLPPLTLARGLHQKDRFVIAAGAIAAVLTLITNKPYLGWERHTWDPMLLGTFLIGAALFLRRWLTQGPDGVRHGLTARRLSAKDKTWMSAGATAIGLAAPNIVATTQPPDHTVPFDGGKSGGGGASSDY